MERDTQVLLGLFGVSTMLGSIPWMVYKIYAHKELFSQFTVEYIVMVVSKSCRPLPFCITFG